MTIESRLEAINGMAKCAQAKASTAPVAPAVPSVPSAVASVSIPSAGVAKPGIASRVRRYISSKLKPKAPSYRNDVQSFNTGNKDSNVLITAGRSTADAYNAYINNMLRGN